MKFLKASVSCSQVKALLRKDFLVRWRQKWLLAIQLLFPAAVFLLPYLIRLKYTPVPHEACQFPTRQLPTTRNTLPGFLSYICSIENKCQSVDVYDEYSDYSKAPLKPVVDIVQIVINDDGLYKTIVELPEKANFISAVTTIVTNKRFGDIRRHIEKVISMVPEVEKALNGSFNIKQLFSDRSTFAKSGSIICGHPFPQVQSIPLVTDILYSEDFSTANQDELNEMPTPYCKRLYMDITSNNYGKITWQVVKPIIQGKILYAPNDENTNSIMRMANSTFEEVNRLKVISVALEQILSKMKVPGEFQDGLNTLIKLARTPFVRSIVGEDFDLDQIEAVIERIRTDATIYDVINTIKNILECFSVDRFEAFDSESELRRKAFEMNEKRLFYAAAYFNQTEGENIEYKFHMDTSNTQATIENKNRFWFPGPSGSMLLDLKYHRGFVQIKNAIDLAIIKHQKEKLRKLGIIVDKEPETSTSRSAFKIEIDNGNEEEEDDDEEEDAEDDDDWFTDSNSTEIISDTTTPREMLTSLVAGVEGVGRPMPIIERTTIMPEDLKDTEGEETTVVFKDIIPETTILPSVNIIKEGTTMPPKREILMETTHPPSMNLTPETTLPPFIDITPEITKSPIIQIPETTKPSTTRIPETIKPSTTRIPETSKPSTTAIPETTMRSTTPESYIQVLESGDILKRQKRQGLLDLFSGAGDASKAVPFAVDELAFYTKQFPYPAYTQDDFKTGIYLGQAIQVAFFLGLVAQIACCVRHLIWMRESKNSMIMRSMGLKPSSEIISWFTTTFIELLIIFVLTSIVMYAGGLVFYVKWIFIMIYMCIFGVCVISFCYLCSTFFSSATIGAVATSVLFFISFCPYIIVLIFDAQLNSLQNFLINLSFTTAFAHGWSHIMRLELQEVGLNFETVLREGLRGEFGFALFMIILDICLYAAIGYVHQRFKDDDNRFVEVQREDLDSTVGATLTNVTKIYNDDKYAVSDISISFPRNKVTCLLGRNGAGKSTIIKMLTGQVVQTTGRVILSQAMSSNKEYDKVGVCSQDNILIPNLTAREHLELYAQIKLKRNYEAEVNKTLEDLKFGKHENYEAGQLSGGYQRRLCVAISFIGSPNVVILDEPCNGVDNKARKDIWELIERLRIGRAVIFATHFLDEAEHLSDVIVIMKNGKIIAKHNPETLKNHCTAYYEVTMNSCDSQTTEEILDKANKLLSNYRQLPKASPTDLSLRISYDQHNYNSSEYLNYLQDLQCEGRVNDLSIESENLEHVFKNLDRNTNGEMVQNNGHSVDIMKNVQAKKDLGWNMVRDKPLTRWEAICQLFWKRLVHFSRNYRMLLCVIVLPAIFEICAMWFVAQRLEDDFDKTIKLSRDLYPKTTQMLSMEIPLNFTQSVYDNIKQDCPGSAELTCKEYPDSKKAFYWILDSLKDYHGQRYGGYTFNESKAIVWYNNKGYHSMLAWLNDLNSYMLQIETNNSNYRITSYNEPWELGFSELSTTSILRQAGDSAMAFVLLIGFSMVVSVAAVYLVNERVKGQKLQQKLCGVDAVTYWFVAFVWDFLVLIVGILVCCSVILAFNMPVFTDRDQLWGVIILALFYGFACIPGIHVAQRLFSDASVAIVGIFNMNVIIPLVTLSIIVLLGVVGDSPTWDDWRHFLNHRLFLIFPQHCLADGLLELCKNYMVAQTFKRYDIDSYKHPINSDLLLAHLIALAVLGVFFLILNILFESGYVEMWFDKALSILGCCFKKPMKPVEELKVISIQNSLKRNDKTESEALRVENISKSYAGRQYAVANVSFAVRKGECFGLLGKNGAGKSTIFKMLSGQLRPDEGNIVYENPEISYCPQTNILDELLTVKECIEFYGKLRRINDIPRLVANILESFQLETYSDVLVKNLSGGNRRKLTVATACCGRTSVVLMDEPTSDMDPVTRAIVYRTIDDLLAEKRAIVLTSHSISEIDAICHRIAVLKDGQMLTCSSPENLKAQFGGYYNVTVYSDQDKLRELEKEITRKFPLAKDMQLYAHSIKFSIKIDNPWTTINKHRENGIDLPEDLKNSSNTTSTPSTANGQSHLTLSELFLDLSNLAQQVSRNVRYAVNKCKLDAVFERIVDGNDQQPKQNGYNNHIKSSALIGSPSTGYIHNGYVETET